MQAMNVLLIDNSPHLQKTLQYFLYPYAPSIYSISSQEELPQKIDIVFLDSEQKNNAYISHLQKKEDKPPIVLVSRDEKILKELSSQYPVSLKKPIQYDKLQDIIHYLIPETRGFKASSYLKFYEDVFEPDGEQPVALSKEKSEKEEAPATLSEKDPPKSIPLTPSEDKEKTLVESSFNKKQAIVIPDDIKLIDEEDSTTMRNTNTFLKKISENIKNKPQTSPKDSDEIEPFPESDMDKTGSKISQSPQKTFSEILEENEISKPTGSEMLETLQETPSKLSTNNKEEIEKPTGSQVLKSPDQTSVDLKAYSPSEDPTKEEALQPASTPSDFKNANIEKWDTLSDKILEIINKHFQDQWEIFINNQLKKDLKEMIHKEVTQVFKEQIKDILTTEGIQSIKKASEEISWKVIPELSKQIIQTEIKKILDKSASK